MRLPLRGWVDTFCVEPLLSHTGARLRFLRVETGALCFDHSIIFRPDGNPLFESSRFIVGSVCQNSRQFSRRIVCLLLTLILSLSGTRGFGQEFSFGQPEVFPAPEAQVSVDSIKPWLESIPLKTRRPGITADENELYYQVLAFARDSDRASVGKSASNFLEERRENSKYSKLPAKEFPVYVDLYLNPEAYHGRPITVTGHVQRCVASPAGKNIHGIEQLYEMWLFTDDSQANPTVIISTEVPKGFPIGEQSIDHVTATGYVYRLYTYEARDKGRFAPILMANSVSWKPATKQTANGPNWVVIFASGLTLLFISMVIGLYWHQAWIIRREEDRSKQDPHLADPPEFLK